MKKLYLSRRQATDLAGDLIEYTALVDSSAREVFQGFEISFGDMLASGVQNDQTLELTPIPNYTLIEGSEVPEKTGI